MSLSLNDHKVQLILQDISQLGTLKRALARHGVSPSAWQQQVSLNPSLQDRIKEAKETYQSVYDKEDQEDDRVLTASEYLDSLLKLKVFKITHKETRNDSGLIQKTEITKELQLPSSTLIERIVTGTLGGGNQDAGNDLNIIFDLANPTEDELNDDDLLEDSQSLTLDSFDD